MYRYLRKRLPSTELWLRCRYYRIIRFPGNQTRRGNKGPSRKFKATFHIKYSTSLGFLLFDVFHPVSPRWNCMCAFIFPSERHIFLLIRKHAHYCQSYRICSRNILYRERVKQRTFWTFRSIILLCIGTIHYCDYGNSRKTLYAFILGIRIVCLQLGPGG